LDTKRKGRTSTGPEGLNGPRRGLQRFFCHGCGKTFTTGRRDSTGAVTSTRRARFASDVTDEAVAAYVEGHGSYRVLARSFSRRLGREVSPRTINRWLAEAGTASMTPLAMSRRLTPPGWGGWIGIDGKHLRIGATGSATLMLAVDQSTRDVVHSMVVPTETGDVFARMLIDAVTEAGYPLRGVVADLGPGAPHMSFPQACRNYFGRLPFQACRVHFIRRATDILSTPAGRPHADTNNELKRRLRQILFSADRDTADHDYYQLTTREHLYTSRAAHTILRSLRRTHNLYMTYHRHPGLPPDANTTENVVRALNRKIRPMEHFATIETADHYSRLLIANYRWKRFTDSNNGHNGRSPLELAGVTLPNQQWLDYLKQAH
jgi:transposase-like protein